MMTVRSGRMAGLALGCLALAIPPISVAQAAAPSAAAVAQDDTVPPITVQIEPPPISISSSMVGVAGPLGAQAVEGKPVFARFVTEHQQVFTDGNRITRSTTSAIYRDSQGRVRRESQLSMPGLPAGLSSATYITIVDRKLGCGWVLNPQEMVAHRYLLNGYVAHLSAQGGSRLWPSQSKPAKGAGTAESRRWRAHVLSPLQPKAMSAASGQPGSAAKPRENGYTGTPATRIDQPFLAAPNPVRTENLGERMIMGFRVHGTRVITTLPAGEIGNARPIDIVSEQWFSPELGLVLRSMHRDPWGGEFTTAVTHISRGKQPANLFVVPPQYQVIDAETESEHHIIESHGSHAPGSASW
jgi:hypothetical protein